jgi:hypothetical protein
MQSTVPPTGQPQVEPTVTDCGGGYYIEHGVEPCGEMRYAACAPDGRRRYANDLWQAQLYVGHMAS